MHTHATTLPPRAYSTARWQALEYYDDALALWPENCDALSYKTELYVETSNRTKALETLTTLCQTCGVQELATEAALSSYNSM